MTSEAKSAKLLPCPFCGGKAEIERFGNTRVSTIYACEDCGCRLETGEEFHHGRAWNRRARLSPGEPSGEAVDRLKMIERGVHSSLVYTTSVDASLSSDLRTILAALTPAVGSEAKPPCPVCGCEERSGAGYLLCECPAPPSPGGADGLEPFMYAYECVDDGRWQAYRQQLKRADGTICPGKPLYARPPEAAAEIEALRARVGVLEQFAEHRNWELSYSYGDEDEDPSWQVHAVNGGRNDREWTLIGYGDTPEEAARQALQQGEGAAHG